MNTINEWLLLIPLFLSVGLATAGLIAALMAWTSPPQSVRGKFVAAAVNILGAVAVASVWVHLFLENG